jgi:hypothetical protein
MNWTPLDELWGTIRANPDLWKDNLIAEALISKVGKGLPQKAENKAKGYLKGNPDNKEKWKFLGCNNGKLRNVLKILVPLTSPIKPIQVTIWVVRNIIKCFFHERKSYRQACSRRFQTNTLDC